MVRRDITEADASALDQLLPEHMTLDDELDEAGIGFPLSPLARRSVDDHFGPQAGALQARRHGQCQMVHLPNFPACIGQVHRIVPKDVGDTGRTDTDVDHFLVDFDAGDEEEKDGAHLRRHQIIPSFRKIGCPADEAFLFGRVPDMPVYRLESLGTIGEEPPEASGDEPLDVSRRDAAAGWRIGTAVRRQGPGHVVPIPLAVLFGMAWGHAMAETIEQEAGQ